MKKNFIQKNILVPQKPEDFLKEGSLTMEIVESGRKTPKQETYLISSAQREKEKYSSKNEMTGKTEERSVEHVTFFARDPLGKVWAGYVGVNPGRHGKTYSGVLIARA